MTVRLRMAMTRFLFRLVERTAFVRRNDSTNIPGDYSKDEFDALRAIWKQMVIREGDR